MKFSIQKIARRTFVENPVIVTVFLVLVLIISFSTSQQYFYVKRFNLNEDVTYWDLFKNQTLRWIIWAIISMRLAMYCRSKAQIKDLTVVDLIRYMIVIAILVVINIVTIATIALFLSYLDGIPVSTYIYLTDYLPFFFFDKLPIYTLGYIFLAGFFHFYYKNKMLKIEVRKLGELKSHNLNLYTQLREKNADKTTVLNIKIGNKQKIIPVEEIYWFEANDYCVNVNDEKNSSYAMRASLKLLEVQLPDNFLRVHRKAIVNMNYVEELNFSNGNNLILNNKIEVPIAKSKMKIVKDYFNQN